MARFKTKTKRKYTRRAIPTATALEPVSEKTLGQEIIEQMKEVNLTLHTLVSVLRNRQEKLEPYRVAPEVTTTGGTLSVPQIAPAEVPKRRGRPPKVKPAEEPAGTVLEKAAEGEPFVHSEFPKTCACGVREDLPPHLHSKHCPVHGDGHLPPHLVKEEPKAEAPKPPSMDDVRGLAIAFIGKHGKEKLSALLTSFGCEMLSGLKPEDRPKLVAKLQEGM